MKGGSSVSRLLDPDVSRRVLAILAWRATSGSASSQNPATTPNPSRILRRPRDQIAAARASTGLSRSEMACAAMWIRSRDFVSDSNLLMVASVPLTTEQSSNERASERTSLTAPGSGARVVRPAAPLRTAPRRGENPIQFQ